MPVRISIALCTLNGAAHLDQQLASLSSQTRLPDELIVADDGSADDSLRILRAFAASAPFPISIEVNSKTLGPAKNFEHAISACTGDIIALCDQDDLWHPDKLATIERAFADRPGLGAFFSDAEMCNANGELLGYRLWTSVGLTGRLRSMLRAGLAFEVILRQNVVTGATLAFDSRFRALLLPIGDHWMHDGWIGLLVSCCALVHGEYAPLIHYRQHASQAVGASRRSLWRQVQNARTMDRAVFADQADAYREARDRLEKFLQSPSALLRVTEPQAQKHLSQLSAKIDHCITRSAIRLRYRSRVASSFREFVTGRYRRFSLGWKSFAQDLFL